MTSPAPQQSILDRPFVLDLFAGPGGLDVAAHTLDIPSFGIEWDKSACLTRYAAGLDTLHADVSAVRRDAFESLPPEINVLAGGPPCQTYSVAGHGAGRDALEKVKTYIDRLIAGESDEAIDQDLKKFSDDQRTALVLEPLRYAIQATRSANRANRPYDVIVLEQVPTVEPVWKHYAQALRNKGLPDGTKYEVVVGVLATETYGVPQTRSRAVLMARRVGLGEPGLPPATHHAYEPKGWNQRIASAGNGVHQPSLDEDSPAPKATEHPKKTDTDLKPWRSMGDVLHGPVGKRTKRFLVRSNYGSSGHPGRRGVRTDEQPAATVTGRISRFVVFEHVDERIVQEGARFTMNEAGILQSFPPDYPWSGTAQAQQVGNAVPPAFGMHLLSAALGLPVPDTEALHKPWTAATEEQQAKLRSHGCGDANACTDRCPRAQDQKPPPSSRPRKKASVKQ
ncbi:DNA cytosine methyltransferase [Streptomyces sp. NPDC059766]|uniref:DNA cytosine methyltransferase n=1 Tax=Streptomyces sp. NPDC059766 TaxID=3346940 RepID=UPI00365699F3